MRTFFLQNRAFFVVSAAISLTSVVRGQIAYIAAKNNGFLPIVGKIICFIYFTLGVTSRFGFLCT